MDSVGEGEGGKICRDGTWGARAQVEGSLGACTQVEGNLGSMCPGRDGTWGALFATPRTVTYQAPRSVGVSRQEYWGGLPFPSPGDLPNPGIEPGSPALQEPPGKPL